MSTTLTIPADVICDVRESLLCLLGGAAEAIVHSLEQPEREHHPEWFGADRRELEDALALLDLTGWDASCEPRSMEVEVARHGSVLKQAVDGYLPLLEDQEAEADLDDRRRTAEQRPPRKSEIVARLSALRTLAVLLEQRLAEEPASGGSRRADGGSLH